VGALEKTEIGKRKGEVISSPGACLGKMMKAYGLKKRQFLPLPKGGGRPRKRIFCRSKGGHLKDAGGGGVW